ncbi:MULTISPECIES: response regulator transcription factor [Sporosarcina]|uniref:response regulator transcription factor n=1 Tax=Sporosarcina TaxID=1569 RepID=UPI00129A8154|nr:MULTISPECIES: response regulator transcription factor [Sporosarcina]GKV65184.1 putative transcriptional regulatory protein YkoG [Sporosarcina sp. NCCP-2331]GLB55308.1 putative transcriptional regulatory protein YkoG [Sporosarcina sp. NCCP-2378]
MTERILIVEDEESIARVLQLELEFEKYETGVAHTGTDGLILFREEKWDLVLLDLMLPGLNGLDVLRRIRSHDEHTPVLLLTAKNDVEDKVKGLDLGANDYITKPFEIEELLARIRTALRIAGHEPGEAADPDLLVLGDLSLHQLSREVHRGEQSVELTPREFDLLQHLLKHPNQVLSREQLLDAVWGYDYFGDTNVVDVYIRYVRKKIDGGEASLIHTVRGVGYVLKEPVHEA